MYLEAIEVENFKSITYASIQSLHRGMNVFVGINGAGKSNLYSAILFGLLDPRFDIKTIHRAQILSNDAKTKSGYVKLTINLEGDTVGEYKDKITITRQFTLTTDTFTINNVVVTSERTLNLLAVMGFTSSSQGYSFALQQNKITSLAMSDPAALLNAFTSSTGLWDYDARRKDALEKLKATHAERDETQAIYEQLRSRCNKMTERMKKNKEYLNLLAERKAAEYTLARATYNQVHDQYTAISEQCETLIRDSDAKRATVASIQTEINKVSTELAPLELKEASTRTMMKNINDYLYSLSDACKYFISLASTRMQKSQEQQESVATRVQNIHQSYQEIAERESSLLTDMSKLQNLRCAIASTIREQTIMLQESGKEQRSALQKEFDDVLRDLMNAEAEHTAIEALQKDNSAKISDVEQRLAEARRKIDDLRENESLEEYNKLSKKRQALNIDLSTQMKELSEIESKVLHEEYQLAQVVHEFLSLAPANIATGTNLCLSAIADGKIPGFRGFLAEHINAAVGSYPALESAIGGSTLYSLVVDSRETATTIIKQLKRDKQGAMQGRANFIVVDAVSPPVLHEVSDSCIPLISLVQTKDDMKKVIQQALGTSYLTKTLEDAAKYAQEHNINCYTISGDVIHGSGVAIGGHRNYKRLRHGVAVGTSREALAKALAAKTQLTAEIKKVKDALQEVSSSLAPLEKIASSMQEELNMAQIDLTTLSEELFHLNKANIKLGIDADNLSRRIDTLKATKQSLEQVLASLTTNKKLNPGEIKALKKDIADNKAKEENLEREIKALEQLIRKTNLDKMKLDAGLQSIEANNNYISGIESKEQSSTSAHIVSLLTILEQINVDTLRTVPDQTVMRLVSDFAMIQTELKSILTQGTQVVHGIQGADTNAIGQLADKLLGTLHEILNTLNTSLLSVKETIINCKQAVGNKEANIELINSELEAAAMSFEALEAERSNILQQYKKADAALKEMQVPLDEELDKLEKEREAANVAPDQERAWLVLYIALKSQQMGETPSVNQHMLNLYNKVKKETSQLEQQLVELADSENAVEELLVELDKKRQEHFNTQFKRVSEGFSHIFHSITGGTGSLSLSTHGNNEPDGLLMDVTFAGNENTGVFQSFGGHSGGQRSLACLCFVLAIEQVSNSPFLLLDEPDACLDEAYRASFTRYLSERVAERAQMFLITFRTELIAAANQCFAVNRREDHTAIEPVPNEYALGIAADAALLDINRRME